MEKGLLSLEDSGQKAAEHRREGDPQAEEEDDLEQFGEFHDAVAGTAL
jgi:hypothetical protein